MSFEGGFDVVIATTVPETLARPAVEADEEDAERQADCAKGVVREYDDFAEVICRRRRSWRMAMVVHGYGLREILSFFLQFQDCS